MKFEDPQQNRATQEDEMRASARNGQRPLLDRLMFRKRITKSDVAQERVARSQALAERLMQIGEATSIQEALQKLQDQGEFGIKSKEQIEKEEYVRARALEVIAKIEEGDYENARAILTRHNYDGKLDRTTQELIEQAVKPAIKKRMVYDVTTKNGDDLVDLIENLHSYLWQGVDVVELIGPDALKEVSADLLRTPEIVSSIQDFCVDTLINKTNVFDRVLEQYINLGLVTKEQIITLPKIKETATKLLMRCPLNEEITSDPLSRLLRAETFGELKAMFIKYGILIDSEIQEIWLKRTRK